MIFVSIAAYRDAELPYTIDSLVKNSTHDLTISVVEQCNRNERIDMSKWASDRVKFTGQWMRPGNAKGAGYARNLAQKPYTNEQYYLQIDSHTELIENWDVKMVDTLKMAQKTEKSSMVVLSQYPAAYTLSNKVRLRLQVSNRYDPNALRTEPMMGKRGQLAAKRIPEPISSPQPSGMLLAGYIFAPGQFTSIEYPKDIPFWGEEFYMSIQSVLNGWKIYAPHEMYVWHHYGRPGPKVWEDVDWLPLVNRGEEFLKETLESWSTLPSIKQYHPTINKWLYHQEHALNV